MKRTQKNEKTTKPVQRLTLVHSDNLKQKIEHKTKYNDEESKRFLSEIATEHDRWHEANLNLLGPRSTTSDSDYAIIEQRVALLEEYKTFLDQQHYAEKFDSRSNLHSSVLEQFMYYLFKDLVGDFGEHALIGKSHTFKDIFFSPNHYAEMMERPNAMIEKKDHDFVIGATFEASFKASTPPAQDKSTGETEVTLTQEPKSYDEVTVTADAETHLFDIPAVAIECKTYLDKTMLEASSMAAHELKGRNPNGLYLVVMEWIKLGDVNPRKYEVDQIYVLRRQKNTDREFRYAIDYDKKPVAPEVVWRLFQKVRNHLTSDWVGGLQHGIERGWLIDEGNNEVASDEGPSAQQHVKDEKSSGASSVTGTLGF